MYSSLTIPCRTLAIVLFVLGFGQPVSSSELSQFLHSVFDEQYQRNPSGTDLYYHSNIYREQGPLENYIAICSSDDFFYRQAHQDPTTYIVSLYDTFVGRRPRPDELDFWVNQFRQSGSPRELFVRRFCEANRVNQLPSFLPTQSGFQTPASAPETANQLVSNIELFINLVRTDLGGSVYARNVIDQSRQLLSAAQQYRQIVFTPQHTTQQAAMALGSMDRSLQGLQQEFHRVPGVSLQCQNVLHQIAQLVDASRYAIDNRTGGQGSQYAVPSEVSQLLQAIRQFTYGLQGYQNQGPFYTNLVRDIQGLAVQIESLNLMLQQGQNPRNVRQAMTEIMNHAGHIAEGIRQADMQVQRGWFNVSTQLQQTAQSLGVRSDYYSQPNSPVVMHQASWVQLPYQPGSSYPSNRNEECIREADQLISQIDGYTTSLRSIAYNNRSAAQMIDSLRDLRHSALALRQTASRGVQGNSLSRASDDLMAQYQTTARTATQLIARDPSLNSPLLYQIGEQIQKLRYAARGVRS